MRDYQKTRVYRAENVAFARLAKERGMEPGRVTWTYRQGPWRQLEEGVWEANDYGHPSYEDGMDADGWPILTLEECRELAERAVGRPVYVRDGRGTRVARAWRLTSTINLPRWSRRGWLVLHEAAHLVSRGRHGPEFVRAYLRLVREQMGVDAYLTLEQAFHEHKVDPCY